MRLTPILILALCLPVFAGDDGEEPAGLLAKRDADGDGRLSPAEFGSDQELFDLLDRDGDGYLTKKELPRARKARPKADRPAPAPELPADRPSPADRMLQMHDQDHDGKLSREEWPAQARRAFEDVDSNGDGFLDAQELGQAFGGRGQPRGDRPPGDRPPPSPEQLQKMAQGILKRFDKDGDGRLSAAELPQGEGRFYLGAADLNQDGAVDLLELTNALQARMREGPGGPRDGAGPEQMLRRVKEMDKNGDGAIEREEWQGPDALFERLDVDQDGRISGKELKQALKEAGGRWNDRVAEAAFRRFDADGDGRITAEEWQGRAELFQRFDANGDGVITRDEVTPQGPKGGRRARMLDLRSGKDSAQFLKEFDKDGDGQVTKAEFPHERRFAEIDADGDGVLSTAEIQDAMDKVTREKSYGFLERFDLDSDGKVTRDEFTGPAAGFERMDKNHDGVIDKADGVD